MADFIGKIGQSVRYRNGIQRLSFHDNKVPLRKKWRKSGKDFL